MGDPEDHRGLGRRRAAFQGGGKALGRTEGHGARRPQEWFVEAQMAESIRRRLRWQRASRVGKAHVQDPQMIGGVLHGAADLDRLVIRLRFVGAIRGQIGPWEDLQSFPTSQLDHGGGRRDPEDHQVGRLEALHDGAAGIHHGFLGQSFLWTLCH